MSWKCHAINRYSKSNNIYTEDYGKNKESSYLKYWDVNNLYGWAISHKFPVEKFEWIKDTSRFNEDFIKSYDEKSDEGYIFEFDVQYPEKPNELHNNLSFLFERMKMENLKACY